MNWKDAPHLFCNGKFKMLTTYLEVTTIKGFYIESGDIWLLGEDLEEYLLQTCTLIARKIKDMTDEELDGCEDLWHDIVYSPLGDRNKIISAHGALEEVSRTDVDVFLHLLSIGVYPFDQSHFEDGTVIDINEVKK